MSSPNPLVAQAPAEPSGFFNAGTGDNGWATGFSIADSAVDAYKGISKGSWIEGGLGVVGLVADAASMAIDPFGTLLSSAASFLMEHMQPLKEALDWLAGDPPVIQSYSTTWGNVSQELGKIAGDYKAAVDGTGEWTGAAADAYRKSAGEQLDALSGAASTAGSVGTVVGVMGMVVGFVREMVRDLIADLVAKLITWVLEAVFTLGFGTPVIVAQAVTAISKWATRIGELIQKLIKTIKKVSPLLGRLVEIFTKIMKVVGKIVGKVTGLDVISTKSIKPGGLFHSTDAPDLSPSGRGTPSSPDGSPSSTPDSSPSPNSPSSPSSPSSPDSSPSSPSSPSAPSSPSSTPDAPSRAPDSSSPSSASPPSAPSPSRTPDSPSAPDAPSPSRTPDGSAPDLPSPSRTPDNAAAPSAPRTPEGSSSAPSGPSAPPHAPSPSSTPDAPARNTGQTVQSSVAPPEAPPRADVPHAPPAPRTPDGSPSTPPQAGPMGSGPTAGGNAPSTPSPRTPDTSTSAARADAPARPSTPSAPSMPHTPSSPSMPTSGAPSGGMPHTPSAGAPHAPSTGAPNAGRPDATPPSRATSPSAAPSTPTHTPSAATPHAPSAGTPHSPNAPHSPSAPPARTDAPPSRPTGPSSPHGGPNAPSRPDAPHHGPTAPSRPDAPPNRPTGPSGPHGGGPNAPHSPNAPHGGPNSPSRPDAPHGGTTTPSSRPDAPHAPSRPDAPNAPHGPNAPHSGPNTPHSPNTPHGPNTPSRPDAPHGGPNSPSRPDAPHRPDSPSRPDGSGPGNRPDGARPDGSRPHSSQSPDAPRSRGTDTAAPPHRPDADAPHKPDAPGHGPDADKPRDHTPDKPHDGDPNNPDGRDPDAPPADRPSPAEAHARHAESTPAGVSHHGGDRDMGDLPHRVPNDPRYFTADVHITPDGRARIGGHDYTPAEYADMLRRSGYDGSRPVRLIGCDAGSNDFAQQLSRHLDAPVLAPTKPAWTDSHGRVFTSDAEIRPDGTRQPKIPPNGEWETHHPDGSRSKTGDDGFAPGTHDKDKDVDPSDAKDREGRPISSEPVPGVEKQDPVMPMKDKVQSEQYRNKYYDGPLDDGSYRRKNATQEDADGADVPVLRRNENGDIEPKPTDYTGSDYRKDIPDDGARKATPEQAERARDLIERRAEANRTANEVEARYQKAKEDGTLTDELQQERTDAHRDRTNRGEDLGEHAASDAIEDMYRDSDLTPVPRQTAYDGAGSFDQVYEIKDADGNTVKYVVVEAKGPNADLGVRQGLDGKNYEQGHPKYVESLLENMRRRGDGDLADELEAAALGGDLDYLVVKAKVAHDTIEVPGADGTPEKTKVPKYGGYDRRHFDLSGYGA